MLIEKYLFVNYVQYKIIPELFSQETFKFRQINKSGITMNKTNQLFFKLLLNVFTIKIFPTNRQKIRAIVKYLKQLKIILLNKILLIFNLSTYQKI